MANFYNKLFSKIKYHLKGGSYGESMGDTPKLKKMRESYSGIKGTAKMGRDLAETILQRITGKKFW